MSTTPVEVSADTTSQDNDGAALVADPVAVAVGGDTPANHFHIRFDCSAINATDFIVSAVLKVKTEQAAVINLDAWMSDFGAAIALGDYDLAGTNTSPIRAQLGQIVASSALDETEHTINIPSRFINRDVAVNSGFTDVEIRPGTGYTPGMGNETSIHGSSAGAGDEPTITYTALTDAEMAAGTNAGFRFLALGSETFLGFDVETTAGQAVKSDILLEVRSTDMDSYNENIPSLALSKNRIKPRKTTVGRAGAGGSFEFEYTPERCWKLLLGMFTVATTGAGPYTHTFDVADSDELKTMTFVLKEGPFRFVYPGCMIDSMGISANLDEIITGSVAMQAREEWMYDESSAGGDSDLFLLGSAAAYDTLANSVLSFVGATIAFDGVTDPGLVQNLSIRFEQSVRERRGLNGDRFVQGHYPGGFMTDVDFTLYFENERQYLKFIGDNTFSYPTRAGQCIELQQVVLTLDSVCGNTNFSCTITIPKMVYTTVRKPVPGEDAVYLQCTGTALLDGSSYTQIVVINDEVSYVPSTDNITVLPDGVSYPS